MLPTLFQGAGGYAWIPSIMTFIDGQILIETATHSFTWKNLPYAKKCRTRHLSPFHSNSFKGLVNLYNVPVADQSIIH